jgi:polysaccharide export outer membrane protein
VKEAVTVMKIRERSNARNFVAALYVALLAVVCASAQQPLENTVPRASSYVLGADDQIVIRVLEGLDLGDKPILIGTNGSITLPLIGRVPAGGLTVEQLEGELVTRLKTYIKDPQVSVTVTDFRSEPVSVFGAVTNPGVVQLRGHKTLYEVLALAGGPRESAGATISIVRLAENGTIPLAGARLDATGRYYSAELDLKEILDEKSSVGNIDIKPHDAISVSQGANRMVYVVGDVQHSGAFSLGDKRSISLLSALSMAGGLGRTAKPETALIFRPSPDGRKHQEIAVNVREVLKGKGEDLALRPDDILVIPTSSSKVFATIVQGTMSGAVSAAIYAGVVH